MARPSTQRVAQGAMLLLLLALVRSAAEFYRLRAALGAEAGLHAFAPFVGGLLIGLVGLGVGLLLYFGGHFRTVVGLVALTLGALLVYKVRVIGL